MTDKFTVEDLMIRVMPGGSLLAIVFLIFQNNIRFNIIDNLDFLYTFSFFCSSFIVGELLQTLAHEVEWLIDLFFKFRRPSKVFLYKNNPVLKNDNIRNEFIGKLKLTKEEFEIFNKEYSDLSIFWWKKKITDDNLSQSIFWKFYSQVSNTNEIIKSNMNYLFSRVIMVESFLISVLLFYARDMFLGIASIVICLLFLWRSRGIARGLVFKTVLLNLKEE
jgi:hypothetical protein